MVLSLLIGFQQIIIIMHFKLNQDAIEQQFCINKNTPELECHGTCHLKKQLKESENKDTAIPKYQRVDMFTNGITSLATKNIGTEIQVKIYIYRIILYMQPFLKILLPPPRIELFS